MEAILVISALPHAVVVETRQPDGSTKHLVKCPRCRREFERTTFTAVTCADRWQVLICCGCWSIPPRRVR